jgi:hypothetical protein
MTRIASALPVPHRRERSRFSLASRKWPFGINIEFLNDIDGTRSAGDIFCFLGVAFYVAAISLTCLVLRETVLGTEHPNTLTTMDNLALVLRDQDKYEQMEETCR